MSTDILEKQSTDIDTINELFEQIKESLPLCQSEWCESHGRGEHFASWKAYFPCGGHYLLCSTRKDEYDEHVLHNPNTEIFCRSGVCCGNSHYVVDIVFTILS